MVGSVGQLSGLLRFQPTHSEKTVVGDELQLWRRIFFCPYKVIVVINDVLSRKASCVGKQYLRQNSGFLSIFPKIQLENSRRLGKSRGNRAWTL